MSLSLNVLLLCLFVVTRNGSSPDQFSNYFIVLVVLVFAAAVADVSVVIVVAVVVGPFSVSFPISQYFAVAVTTSIAIALVVASICCSRTCWFVPSAPLTFSMCSPRSLLRTLSICSDGRMRVREPASLPQRPRLFVDFGSLVPWTAPFANPVTRHGGVANKQFFVLRAPQIRKHQRYETGSPSEFTSDTAPQLDVNNSVNA